MPLKECYGVLGGDYQEVCRRIPSEKLIERFVGRFLEDGSFHDLCAAFSSGSREEAFRAAHTLKGVCANLGFTRLRDSSSLLTELLRPEAEVIPEGAGPLLDRVRLDYGITVDAIRKYQAGKE